MICINLGKICSVCKQPKSKREFQKNIQAPDGLQYRCRSCTSKSSKRCRDARSHLWKSVLNPWNRRPENRDRKNATTRKRMARLKAENPEKFKRQRQDWILTCLYGITQEIKEALIVDQEYTCAICLRVLSLDSPSWAVDHCHKNNFIRGMLCKPCNSAVGLLQDDPAIMRRAADYIEQAQSILDEPTDEDFEKANNSLKAALEIVRAKAAGV